MPVRAVHEQVCQRLRVVSRERVVAHAHVEHAVTLEKLRHRAAAYRGFDRVVRVGHRDPVRRQRRAVEFESQLWLAELLLHSKIGNSAHLRHHP